MRPDADDDQIVIVRCMEFIHDDGMVDDFGGFGFFPALILIANADAILLDLFSL